MEFTKSLKRRACKTLLFFIGWLVIFYLWDRPVPAAAGDLTFQVSFGEAVHDEPYTGSVYLFFSKKSEPPPRFGPNWFYPEPFVSLQVTDWKPGETIAVSVKKSTSLRSFPKPLTELSLGQYHVQAVVRFNPDDHNIGTGVGNGYSQVVSLQPVPGSTNSVSLHVNRIVQPRKFQESQWCKLFRMRSDLLSKFHQRDVFMRAAVTLPVNYYDRPQRRFPVIFEIPGFGGTHFRGMRHSPVNEQNDVGVEFIRVMLDPSCRLGHHVFADSANNGPVGRALIEEFIPRLDRHFRTIAQPEARFLTGHSSGGWSSLWLQVTYPDFFAGTWSTAPDPVDFRDFQRINLYRDGENMYRDAQGARRPLGRAGEKVLVWYEDFARMESVLGHGGMLHSFEAAFSPRGADGKPMPVWDRTTGQVNTAVAKTWEQYDIRLILERNWKTWGPKLKGKLHIFTGALDSFYLEGAARLLKQSLQELRSDAVVEIVPGKRHGSVRTKELLSRIQQEMAERFLMHFPDHQPSATSAPSKS